MARRVLRYSSVRHAGFIFLLPVLLGCRPKPPDLVTANHREDLTATLQAVQRRMHERFSSARQLEESIALGDLERARTSAGVIAGLDEPEALPEWQPYIAGIRETAHQIEFAATTVAAARSATILGMRCAHCHVALEARVTFTVEPRPFDDQKRTPQMLAHQWAALQMWEGIIAPSDDRWLAGAVALTTVPINTVANVATPRLVDDLDDIARIRRYGERALTARSAAARVDLFGDILATCAHCHAALRDR